MRKVKQPYIGGIFASADDADFKNTPAANFFPENIGNNKRVFFETGADAIASAVTQLADSEVDFHVPANFCAETIERIKAKSGKNIVKKIYNNTAELTGAKGIALLLHYNCHDPKISEAAANLKTQSGLFVIEDFVQAPFDIAKFKGHMALNSLRKVCSVEVAVAYISWDVKGQVTSAYLTAKRAAMQLREEFLQSGSKEAEQQQLAKLNEAQAADLSDIYIADAKSIADLNTTDFAAIRAKRAANAKHLAGLLQGLKGLEILPYDHFFLMVRLQERDALRKTLFAQGIFPPIHWQDSGNAQNLLSLPTDQRYDAADMERMAKVIKDALL